MRWLILALFLLLMLAAVALMIGQRKATQLKPGKEIPWIPAQVAFPRYRHLALTYVGQGADGSLVRVTVLVP